MAGIDQEQLMQAKDLIMGAVCDLCHWPYHYRAYCLDEVVMYAEKCDACPAEQAVEAALARLAYHGKHEAEGGAT